MKTFALALLGIAGLAFSSYGPLPQSPPHSPAGNGPVFDASLPKFTAVHPDITWAVPANRSQAALWIYHVVPQNFPGAMVSNLMALGSFSARDEHKWHRSIGSVNGQPLLFVNASNTCDLLILPSQGWIKYHDQYAPANRWDKILHLHERVERLPEETEAETLGLQFLHGLGIERADLVQNATGHLITFGTEKKRSYFDKASGKYVDDEVIARGIYFNRRIDGVNFAGIGLGAGCEIVYGNHAKIAELNLVWRNLQPYEHLQVASADEIMQWIQDGKAVLTHKNPVNPRDIRKLTITDMSPLYMGASGEEAQDFVYPFAQLEAAADMGGTNINVQLYCPILSTNIITVNN